MTQLLKSRHIAPQGFSLVFLRQPDFINYVTHTNQTLLDSIKTYLEQYKIHSIKFGAVSKQSTRKFLFTNMENRYPSCTTGGNPSDACKRF